MPRQSDQIPVKVSLFVCRSASTKERKVSISHICSVGVMQFIISDTVLSQSGKTYCSIWNTWRFKHWPLVSENVWTSALSYRSGQIVLRRLSQESNVHLLLGSSGTVTEYRWPMNWLSFVVVVVEAKEKEFCSKLWTNPWCWTSLKNSRFAWAWRHKSEEALSKKDKKDCGPKMPVSSSTAALASKLEAYTFVQKGAMLDWWSIAINAFHRGENLLHAYSQNRSKGRMIIKKSWAIEQQRKGWGVPES